MSKHIELPEELSDLLKHISRELEQEAREAETKAAIISAIITNAISAAANECADKLHELPQSAFYGAFLASIELVFTASGIAAGKTRAASKAEFDELSAISREHVAALGDADFKEWKNGSEA